MLAVYLLDSSGESIFRRSDDHEPAAPALSGIHRLINAPAARHYRRERPANHEPHHYRTGIEHHRPIGASAEPSGGAKPAWYHDR
eukprot:912746-Prorocentrum_minimum.AAC.1